MRVMSRFDQEKDRIIDNLTSPLQRQIVMTLASPLIALSHIWPLRYVVQNLQVINHETDETSEAGSEQQETFHGEPSTYPDKYCTAGRASLCGSARITCRRQSHRQKVNIGLKSEKQ